MNLRVVGLWLLAAFTCASSVRAHPLTPAVLHLRERAAGRYEGAFRRPELLAARLSVIWPDGCTTTGSGSHSEGDQRVDGFTLACAHGLRGQTLQVAGLAEVGLGLLVHIELAGEDSLRTLLGPERASWQVPERSSARQVLADYGALGIEHLLTGPDHLLFVFGLMLLVTRLKQRIATLSAFTVGHSITLALSALSVVSLPSAPVEIGIAASLIVLALSLLEPDHTRASHGQPWLMAVAFGLLHGLGFAGALAEAGLPQHAIALSLLGFNLGIELGQVAVVLLLAGLARGFRNLLRRHAGRLRPLAAYAIGALAAMWCIERTLAAFVPG